MKLVKVNSKWKVEGEREGWVFQKTFRTKWQAELAMRVFEKGDRFQIIGKQKEGI